MSDDRDVGDVVHRVESMEAAIKHLQQSLAQIGRRLDHEAPRLHSTTYHSIESLLAVYRQLDPSAVLPPLSGPFGGWSIGSDMARLICEMFAVCEPVVVLDLGSGASTILMGHLLKRRPGARVVSLDHDSVWYVKTLEMVRRCELEDVVDLRFAPLTKVEVGSETFQWYHPDALSDVADVDVVFVDGPPGHIGPRSRYPAGPIVAPMCRPGSLFIVDDTVRQEERDMVDLWRHEMGMLLLEEHVWHSKGASVLRFEGRGGRGDE